MKKTVSVTKTSCYEIDIPDNLLTPEEIKEFESMMWELYNPVEDLFKYAATLAADGHHYVEGLGPIGPGTRSMLADKSFIIANRISLETECEVICG